jgi:hypothetical protein
VRRARRHDGQSNRARRSAERFFKCQVVKEECYADCTPDSDGGANVDRCRLPTVNRKLVLVVRNLPIRFRYSRLRLRDCTDLEFTFARDLKLDEVTWLLSDFDAMYAKNFDSHGHLACLANNKLTCPAGAGS